MTLKKIEINFFFCTSKKLLERDALPKKNWYERNGLIVNRHWVTFGSISNRYSEVKKRRKVETFSDFICFLALNHRAPIMSSDASVFYLPRMLLNTLFKDFDFSSNKLFKIYEKSKLMQTNSSIFYDSSVFSRLKLSPIEAEEYTHFIRCIDYGNAYSVSGNLHEKPPEDEQRESETLAKDIRENVLNYFTDSEPSVLEYFRDDRRKRNFEIGVVIWDDLIATDIDPITFFKGLLPSDGR